MKFCAALLAAFSLSGADLVSFKSVVQPILAERCQVCHNSRVKSGNLNLSTAVGIAAGGISGPAVKAGHPEKSLLLQSILGEKPKMPKTGPPLTADQIALIRRWIEQGAHDDTSGKQEDETWWSLRPLVRPAVPKTTAGWVHTPVDAFIQDRLLANKLTPSDEANKRTLIRRLYYDLHGLPPAPADVDAFVNDTAPDAYERLVERLLASPRYGERWARHWLDVIHYGESHGYDKDKPRLNAWPYRDYLIQSLNKDKPYPRFIEEQIAGDVLFPDSPEAFVATGFIAAGPWDFVGHQELREGTVDKDTTRVLDRDDMVATTMSTFTSMTAHCARCHDHKFDPIPQQEYYNLQAVFAGVDRADRPFDDDPAVHVQRQKLLRERQAIQLRLQPLLDKVEFATSPDIVALDSSIQDAGLLIVHMGEPKTAADAELKKQLESRRTADRKHRQELVDAIVGPETYAAVDRIKAEFKSVDARLEALPKPRMVYSATGFFTRAGNFRPALQPRPISVLLRGNVRSPGNTAVPGALSCVPSLNSRFDLEYMTDEGSRRAALAKWISNSDNVLTWRSIVNRVWQYHFGSGIVETANDFGRMGGKPSHPELLDWLAVWFRDDAKGSLKSLHKLLLTSAAYRQSSRNRDEAARIDADNRLLWRMNRSRMDAEALRDSMLSVAGKLDLTMGGPAVRMFFFKDDHSPVYDYSRFDPDSEGAHRRTIYRFIVRSVPDPFMERLDCPDPSVLTPKRSTTITAIQALAVLNNPFVIRMAEHFSARAGSVENAVQLAFGREPSAEELASYSTYAKKHGMTNLCRLLFNTNEFLFVD